MTNSQGWLKAELHAHCRLDPTDYRVCRFGPEQLISEAARLGYQVLAITCHNQDVWSKDLSEYADDLGITLIPGMEVSVLGSRHVLAYNFHTASTELNTIEKLRSRKREDNLVVAPHSFFPARSCLRGLLLPNLDVFDAIELSGFYTSRIDFNRRAVSIAARHGKPVVGNGDVHQLWQLGKTFTWIESAPGILPVLRAIKQGRVRVETAPLTLAEVAKFWAVTFWRSAVPAGRRPDDGYRIPQQAQLIDE